MAALGIVGVAAAYDVRTRRIPNLLTFGGAVVGVGLHAFTSGLAGVWFAVAGWSLGLALFLPFYLLRGLGAGDVKLLAAVGAFLGAAGVSWAALFTVLAGGVLALFVAMKTRYLGTALRNVWTVLGFWRIAGLQPYPGLTMTDARLPRLPYGVAIAAGTLAAIWFN